jgi:type I restriction enzyme M protein
VANPKNEIFQVGSIQRVEYCYFLIKIQSDNSIKTPDDLWNSLSDIVVDTFPAMPLDDACSYFKDNKERWDEFVGMAGKYSNDELAEAAIYAGGYADAYGRSRKDIAGLINTFLDVQKGERVLQLTYGMLPEYVLESREKFSDITYSVYDDGYVTHTLEFILSDIMGMTGISFYGNDIEDAVENKYDKIFVDSLLNPLGKYRLTLKLDFLSDVWAEFPYCESEAWVDCGVALKALKNGGRIVALMDGGDLTVKQTEKVRKFMCNGGFIEGVIKLPDKLHESTWVSSYLVIIGRDNKSVRFYDASDKYNVSRIKGKRINVLSAEKITEIFDDYNNNNSVASVDMETISKNNYNLSPVRYLINKDANENTVSLGDVVSEIKRGMTLTAAEIDELVSDEPSPIQCITAAGITGSVVSSSLYYHGEIKKQGKNEAWYDDLLINKVGNPFKVALTHDKYLVIGNIYILKIDRTKINPAYVRCFLNSEQGQNELKRYSVGAVTPMISVANVQKVQIPVYDEDKQQEISKKCEEIEAEIVECYKTIKDREREINELFC